MSFKVMEGGFFLRFCSSCETEQVAVSTDSYSYAVAPVVYGVEGCPQQLPFVNKNSAAGNVPHDQLPPVAAECLTSGKALNPVDPDLPAAPVMLCGYS
jgi:hypothetical protein